MVIGDHHRHAQLLRPADLLHGGDAVVAGEQSVHPVLVCRFYDHPVNTVAVFDPVRNLIIHLRSHPGQRGVQDISGTDPVDIIVSDNADTLSIRDLLLQNGNRQIHIL